MAAFILGLAVAVFVNLVTALVDRRKALRLIPWVSIYILFHGVSVVATSDSVKDIAMDIARKYPPAWTYPVVVLTAAVLAGLGWKAVISATSKLEQATSTTPNSPAAGPQEGHATGSAPSTEPPTPVKAKVESPAAAAKPEPKQPSVNVEVTNSPGAMAAGRDLIVNPAPKTWEPLSDSEQMRLTDLLTMRSATVRVSAIMGRDDAYNLGVGILEAFRKANGH